MVKTASFSNRPNRPPVIDFSILDNPNNLHISSTTIIFNGRKEKYIIYGYFDSTADINYNLARLCPANPWRGEIIIFSLGQRVRMLSRPYGTKDTLEMAIKS